MREILTAEPRYRCRSRGEKKKYREVPERSVFEKREIGDKKTISFVSGGDMSTLLIDVSSSIRSRASLLRWWVSFRRILYDSFPVCFVFFLLFLLSSAMTHWTSSGISKAYSAFRPTYPNQLYTEVLQHVPVGQRRRLVDIGCGTGQVFQGIGSHFTHCVGIDPSQSQVDAATPFNNATYLVGSAEEFKIPDTVPNGPWEGNVDLVTVAQAMHWFDMPKFLKRMDSLLAPGGIFTCWLYDSVRILNQKDCDEMWDFLDKLMLRSRYWPNGRKHIDDHYAKLAPMVATAFDPVCKKVFAPTIETNVEQFINYMGTMSGVNKYKSASGHATVLEDYSRNMTEFCGAASPAEAKLMTRHNFVLFVFKKPEVGSAPKSKL